GQDFGFYQSSRVVVWCNKPVGSRGDIAWGGLDCIFVLALCQEHEGGVLGGGMGQLGYRIQAMGYECRNRCDWFGGDGHPAIDQRLSCLQKPGDVTVFLKGGEMPKPNQDHMNTTVRKTNKRSFRFYLPAVPLCLLMIAGCFAQGESEEVRWEIERYDPRLDKIVASEARVEVLAEGFDWTEGPLWVEAHQMLLFSDIPQNSIYKWTEKEGVELYLKPS